MTPPRGPELRTERLLLRRFAERDLEPFAALNADPEVMEFFPAPLTRDESDALVQRIDYGFDANGYGIWAVELPDSGRFIGMVGLNAVHDMPFSPVVELVWRLAREFWGHGYATEAAAAARRFAFVDLGMAELVAYTARINLRSRRVMERLGMTYEAAADFDHPRVPAGSPLRPHVLYRTVSGA